MDCDGSVYWGVQGYSARDRWTHEQAGTHAVILSLQMAAWLASGQNVEPGRDDHGIQGSMCDGDAYQIQEGGRWISV